MIDLSIIIVSWNAREFLSKCLWSLKTSMTDYYTEIIVVDNASTDGSQELVRDQFPRVNLICNDTNLGFAKAINIGVSHCRGKYVCLINSDVEVLEDCFVRMIAYMEHHPEVGMLGPQIIDPNGNIQRSCMGFPTLWNTFCRALALDSLFPKVKLFGGYLMTYWEHNTMRNVDVINGCFWMIKREALDQVGLLDEQFFIYAEDLDWCKRFTMADWEIVYFPMAEALHYGGASSSNAPVRFYIEMQKANLKFWRKHYGRFSYSVYYAINVLHHFLRVLGYSIHSVLLPQKSKDGSYKILRSISSIKVLLGVNKDRLSYDQG